MDLNTPLALLKGVGTEKAKILESELHLFTFYDLLEYFPFRYVDKGRLYKICEIHPELDFVQVKGKIVRIEELGGLKQKRLKIIFQDDTGNLDLIWFKNYIGIQKKLREGQIYIASGKVHFFNSKANIPHPELQTEQIFDQTAELKWEPIYSNTQMLQRKGFTNKKIVQLQKNLLELTFNKLPEIFPLWLLEELKLISRQQAYHWIHFPEDQNQIALAQKRLKFEELFFLQLTILHQKNQVKRELKGFVFEKLGDYFHTFYAQYLPFELTNAQKRVIKEIRNALKTGAQMNRLVQGDVGSGKTMVAFLSMLMALDNGFQSLMMAPTEILAQQHYHGFKALIEKEGACKLSIKIAFLSGNVKGKARQILLEELAAGKIHILVGTHALIEEPVVFHNLGLAVIDEQHRFGVKQRALLWGKNKVRNLPPHILVMTATPIPRTLAMTVYGDLDISMLDELPPGRKPIQTIHLTEAQRLQVFGHIKKEIEKGRQVYIVYPLIEESEHLDYANLMDGYNSMLRYFPRPAYQISMVHGQMKQEDKNYEMERFIRQETQIMVATTVIEVGVNVPNASVMLIENAEKFGLSQLHQLRGRVGRGAEKSYCLLMTKTHLQADAKERIQTMVRTQDGFEIAEVDLNLRGAGDLMGTQQSGVLNLKIANLSSDGFLLQEARKMVLKIIDTDATFEWPEHQALFRHFQIIRKQKPNWGRIS